MTLQRTTTASVVVGFLFASIHLTPGYAVSQLIDGDWAWFPRAETMAETIRWYQATSSAVLFVLGFACVFAIGYWTGRRVDLAEMYSPVFTAIGAGGAVGYLAFVGAAEIYLTALAPLVVGHPLVDLLVETGPVDGLTLLGRSIAVPVQFGIVGFAGAALAHLARDADRPEQPTTSSEEWTAGTTDS